MSHKNWVIDVIRRLPDSATLAQIRERIDFLAAVQEAELSLDRGEGVAQEEVEKQFSNWVKSWPTRSSGLRKRSKTSVR